MKRTPLRKVSDKQRKKNHEWAEVVKHKKTKIGCKCEVCGVYSDNIDGHHIVFRSQGGKNTLENCLLVCCFCHHKIHFGNSV